MNRQAKMKVYTAFVLLMLVTMAMATRRRFGGLHKIKQNDVQFEGQRSSFERRDPDDNSCNPECDADYKCWHGDCYLTIDK
ncbi:hypothetical protein ACROYT_G012286 [Oculina patagonica]